MPILEITFLLNNVCVRQLILKYIFFVLILDPLTFPSIYWHHQGRMGCQEIDRERKEERIKPKHRYVIT